MLAGWSAVARLSARDDTTLYEKGCRLTERFLLPARLDSSGAIPLVQALQMRRGQPLCLDASEVEVIGALALEVIIAAARQWAADDQPFSLAAPSKRFCATCTSLGLCSDAPWLPVMAITDSVQVAV
jgi:anti-anti-sigma regulatory factor